MQNVISDLHQTGAIFVAESDNRFDDPRYLASIKYIDSLQIDKTLLNEQMREESKKVFNSIPKNEHPIYVGLVNILNNLKSPDYSTENHMIANEFIRMYINS